MYTYLVKCANVISFHFHLWKVEIVISDLIGNIAKWIQFLVSIEGLLTEQYFETLKLSPYEVSALGNYFLLNNTMWISSDTNYLSE